MKKYILSLFLLVYLTNGFSQTGIMDNFDDNVADPNWKYLLSCPACYQGTEINSELQVVTTNVGPAYENFEFDFAAIDLTANPVVKINVKNTVAFNMRIDLTDITGNATNASPTVVAIPVSASYVQYTFNFAGKFSQTTPTAATVDITKIVKAVIFVNPGGTALSTTVFFNDLIVGSPAAPVASFTKSATAVCTGVPVTFTNTSSNGITSYAWDFGSGASPATASTYTPPTVTWSTAGTKAITLTVTGPGGTNVTPIANVTVSAFPNAAGTISGSSSQCNGSSATYSLAAVTNATGYTWNLPTGSSVTANPNTNNVTITFGTTGGNISVTPTNACGNGAASPNLPITLSSSVAAGVSVTSSVPSNSICSGNSVTFTAVPTNGGTAPTYQWKINGSNAGATSSTFTTSTLTNGNSVTVTMGSNAACVTGSPKTSAPIVMNVSSGGAPTISISTAKQTICSGDIVIFTTAVTNGGPSPSFIWKQNGTTIPGETDDSLVANIIQDKDVFSAVVTASGCGTGSATSNLFTINVTPSNIANVFTSTPYDTVCLNATTTFTIAPAPVNGGTSPLYQWQVNGSNISGETGTTFNRILNNDDIVTVVMTSNSAIGCLRDNPATSTPLKMKVVSSMTSAVNITSTATTICSGLPVTFTATPLRNGGASPSYQWRVNGVNQVGQTASTFTSSSLANTNQVTCVMTSSISCASPSTSNAITITVTSTVAPSVTVSTPSTSVCTNDLPTFTANPTNGGASPTYQWKINSTNVGVNPTFTPVSGLTNNDVVSVVMTSSLSCASTPTATSPGVLMTVNPKVAPSVVISASATSVCPGTGITFTAVPTNGGTGPTYLWKTNGIPTGNTGATYTVANLVNKDTVTCELTSNYPCLTTTSATSNKIGITVSPTVAASVIISSNPTPLCPSTAVTFTAVASNGGSTPVYVWKVNGGMVGTNSPTYSNSGLAAGNTVTCQMTSNAACVIGSPATSNTLTVNPSTNATIVISASANPICSGTNVDFTSVTSGGGTSPSFVWKNKGAAITGATGSTFSSSTLASGDIISCVMTSDAVCAIGSPATSNPITMNVTAVPAISVSISTPTQSICGGSSATFTATPVNAGPSPNYQWQVNGQDVGSNSNVFSSATFSNNDAVQVIMTSSAACAGSTATSPSKTMTVSNPPSAANAGFEQFVTTSTALLSATPPSSGTGAWSTAGSATITGAASGAPANSNVSNLSLGANTFTWTVTSGVCPSSTSSVVINYGSKPTTKTIIGKANVVKGSITVPYYIAPVEPGSSYTWTTSPGATISYGQGSDSITINFASTTTSADIFVTEFNKYGDYTAPLHITLGPAPTLKTITGPDYEMVNSTNITYSIAATGGSTYLWTVTGGATPTSGTSNIISLNFGPTPGTVNLSVTETNIYGSRTATKDVTVGNAPATPVIMGPDSVVTGKTYKYYVDLHTGSSYLWYPIPNGTTFSSTSSDTVYVTFTASGSYNFVVIESNNSGPNSGASNTIKAGPSPIVGAITGATTVQAGVQYTYIATTNSAGNSNFYWTFSPVQPTIVSRNANSITVIFPANMTTETMSVVQDNGFDTDASTPLTITMSPSGLSHTQHTSIAYTMYPNPFSSDGMNLTFNTSTNSNLSLSICNMNGEIIFSSNEYRTNETIVLGRDLPVGLYILKAITDDKVQVIKINKE